MADSLEAALEDVFWKAFNLDHYIDRFGYTDRTTGRIDGVVPQHLFELLAEAARAELADAVRAAHPTFVAGFTFDDTSVIVGVHSDLPSAFARLAELKQDGVGGDWPWVEEWADGTAKWARRYVPPTDPHCGLDGCGAASIVLVIDPEVQPVKMNRCVDHLTPEGEPIGR